MKSAREPRSGNRAQRLRIKNGIVAVFMQGQREGVQWAPLLGSSIGRLSGVGALWDCVPRVCGGGGGCAGGGVPLGGSARAVLVWRGVSRRLTNFSVGPFSSMPLCECEMCWASAVSAGSSCEGSIDVWPCGIVCCSLCGLTHPPSIHLHQREGVHPVSLVVECVCVSCVVCVCVCLCAWIQPSSGSPVGLTREFTRVNPSG